MLAQLTDIIRRAEAEGRPLDCLGISEQQAQALAREIRDFVLHRELLGRVRPTALLGVPIKLGACTGSDSGALSLLHNPLEGAMPKIRQNDAVKTAKIRGRSAYEANHEINTNPYAAQRLRNAWRKAWLAARGRHFDNLGIRRPTNA